MWITKDEVTERMRSIIPHLRDAQRPGDKWTDDALRIPAQERLEPETKQANVASQHPPPWQAMEVLENFSSGTTVYVDVATRVVDLVWMGTAKDDAGAPPAPSTSPPALNGT